MLWIVTAFNKLKAIVSLWGWQMKLALLAAVFSAGVITDHWLMSKFNQASQYQGLKQAVTKRLNDEKAVNQIGGDFAQKIETYRGEARGAGSVTNDGKFTADELRAVNARIAASNRAR